MTNQPTLRILGICGSLRRKSYNMYTLKAAGELMPAGMSLELAEIGDIPLFNQDVYEQGFPPPAARLRGEVGRADALLIASPEYNLSLTAALKNAIDWLSRKPGRLLADKPVAIVSAAKTSIGGARGQYDLRRMLGHLEAFCMPLPEIFVGEEEAKFDADGTLVHGTTRAELAEMMGEFRRWILRVKAMPPAG